MDSLESILDAGLLDDLTSFQEEIAINRINELNKFFESSKFQIPEMELINKILLILIVVLVSNNIYFELDALISIVHYESLNRKEQIIIPEEFCKYILAIMVHKK
jgi:hypothetical protein